MQNDRDVLEVDIHPGWRQLNKLLRTNLPSRRRFLPAAATATGALWPSLLLGDPSRPAASPLNLSDKASRHSNSKVKHVVILCQENRSLDQYFGSLAAALGKTGNRPGRRNCLGA